MKRGSNLFGVPDKEPKKPAPAKAGPGEVQRLIGVWAKLFEARFGEKPIVTGRDGAALKRLIAHSDAATVERRLKVYLALDDAFIASQGYPLGLMLGAWNRLVAQDRPEPSRVPSAERTAEYIRNLKASAF